MLGIGEWGLWRQGAMTPAQADDPVYVDNMYRFFKGNAGSIAYDTYTASDSANGGHALCPSTAFPRAAAQYRADWSAGK